MLESHFFVFLQLQKQIWKMNKIPVIHIEDYHYDLPDDRIAKYPLPDRDSSKLLYYINGSPTERKFKDIAELLPENSLMIFNDTKVVPARLFFQRETGANIEIFCLKPSQPEEYIRIFETTSTCRWECIVGNIKRWKGDVIHLYNPDNNQAINELDLTADLIERKDGTAVVEFRWKNGLAFSQVLETAGNIPIPPYLNRQTENIDLERYQTLYARYRGSVAAPTAGLHFTENVLKNIKDKGIEIENVCLHVGAGTFLPVKSSLVSEHTMHKEPFVVTLNLIEKLLKKDKQVIAVGTTSVRTLESLYYAGLKCIRNGKPGDVSQWEAYDEADDISTEESLMSLAKYLQDNNLTELKIGTEIIIVPGFKFRIVDYLVTNFHQPQSTLLLLISAFVGGNWQNIYKFALMNNYRFLSYGDSSLLVRAH